MTHTSGAKLGFSEEREDYFMHFSRFHRRLWSVLLAMVMVFSAVVPAMAAEDHSESGQADTLFWEKIDNGAFSAPSPFREDLRQRI